jgi:hypothetical protein
MPKNKQTTIKDGGGTPFSNANHKKGQGPKSKASKMPLVAEAAAIDLNPPKQQSNSKQHKQKKPEFDSSWLNSLVSTQVKADASKSKGVGGQAPTMSKEERKAKRAATLSAKLTAKAERFGVDVAEVQPPKRRKEKESSQQQNASASSKAIERKTLANKRYIPSDEGGGHAFLRTLNKVIKKACSAEPSSDDEEEEEEAPLGPTPAKKQKMSESAKIVQPRSKDYNGQGLARPSIYMDFDSGDFEPRFTQQFGEHVEGFFGKVRTKGMKKQAAKKNGSSGGGQMDGALGALMGDKSLDGLTADEKVEALMKKGLL